MRKRYCIFRTDAIGDLVLTLPMAFAVKAAHPDAHVTFCVQEYTKPLVALCPAIDDVVAVPGRDIDRYVLAFARRLKSEHFSAAVFAYPRPLLALAAKLAGIPQRVGTAYRYYSFLFTSRHAEHRKESVHHESTYNLHLLQPLGIDGYTPELPLLEIPGTLDTEADRILSTIGLDGRPYIILHPGSGGSARDWDAASFGALGAKLAATYPDHRILVTGTESEQEIVTIVTEAAGGRAVALPAPVALDVFAAVIEKAELLIANSTGPLHIAAALNVPVVGLYPDEPALHPRRWGPLGLNSVVLTPQSVAGQQVSESAPMHVIRVEHVLEAANTLLSGTDLRTGRIKK